MEPSWSQKQGKNKIQWQNVKKNKRWFNELEGVIKQMCLNLEDKALKVLSDKFSQHFCQTIYKLWVRNDFVIIKQAWVSVLMGYCENT